jgi:hypothetical protein
MIASRPMCRYPLSPRYDGQWRAEPGGKLHLRNARGGRTEAPATASRSTAIRSSPTTTCFRMPRPPAHRSRGSTISSPPNGLNAPIERFVSCRTPSFFRTSKDDDGDSQDRFAVVVDGEAGFQAHFRNVTKILVFHCCGEAVFCARGGLNLIGLLY